MMTGIDHVRHRKLEIVVNELVPKTQVRPNCAPVKVCIPKDHNVVFARTSPINIRKQP